MQWLDLTRPIEAPTTDNSGQTHMDIGVIGNHPPLDELIRPGVCLDVRAQAATGTIELDGVDLTAVTEGCAVVFNTGWAQHFGTPTYTACPDIQYELVDALLDRGAKLLMVDSPGVYGGARSERHSAMDLHIVDRGAIAVEHLCNVDHLPTTFTLYCFPLHVTGQNWLPARVVASW
jgi:kynurenine formamidase